MDDLPGLVITGASGRMGQMLTEVVSGSETARLVAVLEREGHPWIGQDAGVAAGGPAIGVTVTD
ncbi:MAG: 4-hydroxy-tetrahydrodipicolinate reductase, partial [Pseudomonadota bacterium]